MELGTADAKISKHLGVPKRPSSVLGPVPEVQKAQLLSPGSLSSGCLQDAGAAQESVR